MDFRARIPVSVVAGAGSRLLLLRLSTTILALVTATVWAWVLPDDVSADDAFQGGNCWQGGTLQCAAGYSQGNYYYYRVNTAWSGTTYETEGAASLTAAKSSWSNSPGPQWFVSWQSSSTPYMPVYTWMYPTYQSGNSSINNTLSAGAVAVTVNWKWNGSNYEICFTNAC